MVSLTTAVQVEENVLDMEADLSAAIGRCPTIDHHLYYERRGLGCYNPVGLRWTAEMLRPDSEEV